MPMTSRKPEAAARQPALQGLRHALRLLPRSFRPASHYALPHYIIIGAQKAGTTALDLAIAQHPNARTSLVQEVHFFDKHYPKGPNWYRRHFHTESENQHTLSQTGHPLRSGESTPYYMFHPDCPRRVRKLIPEVRLIALLRDPVARAWSHYHHETTKGYDTVTPQQAFDQSFEAQRLQNEENRILRDPAYFSFAHNHFAYLARGRYAAQLEHWLEFFPREKLLVLCSERFYADSPGTLATVFRFLDLPDWTPPPAKKLNARAYSGIDPAIRKHLVDYYAPHNEQLFRLIGERFHEWASPTGD